MTSQGDAFRHVVPDIFSSETYSSPREAGRPQYKQSAPERLALNEDVS